MNLESTEIPSLHLETMGSSESGNTESYEVGHTEIFFLQMAVCESLLGHVVGDPVLT